MACSTRGPAECFVPTPETKRAFFVCARELCGHEHVPGPAAQASAGMALLCTVTCLWILCRIRCVECSLVLRWEREGWMDGCARGGQPASQPDRQTARQTVKRGWRGEGRGKDWSCLRVRVCWQVTTAIITTMEGRDIILRPNQAIEFAQGARLPPPSRYRRLPFPLAPASCANTARVRSRRVPPCAHRSMAESSSTRPCRLGAHTLHASLHASKRVHARAHITVDPRPHNRARARDRREYARPPRKRRC